MTSYLGHSRYPVDLLLLLTPGFVLVLVVAVVVVRRRHRRCGLGVDNVVVLTVKTLPSGKLTKLWKITIL